MTRLVRTCPSAAAAATAAALATAAVLAAGACQERDTRAPAASTARFAALSQLDVEGFIREADTHSQLAGIPVYVAEQPGAEGNEIVVHVTVRACEDCLAMQLAVWRRHADRLHAMLPRVHREDPALVFTIDEIELGKRRGIAVYTVSYVERHDARGQLARPTANGLTVYFNDGATELSVMVTARGTSVTARSAADLERELPRADAEAAARTVFLAFAERVFAR